MEDSIGTAGGSGERLSLVWALGVSGVVHVVLFMLLLAIGWAATRSARVVPEPDSIIHFTFSPTLAKEPTVGEVRGVIPLEAPRASSRALTQPGPKSGTAPALREDRAEARKEPPARETSGADVESGADPPASR